MGPLMMGPAAVAETDGYRSIGRAQARPFVSPPWGVNGEERLFMAVPPDCFGLVF